MSTPKQAFQESPYLEDFKKFAGTKMADAARDAALLEFIAQLPVPSDPAKSWDQGSQLAGAKAVLSILFSLHLTQEPKGFARLSTLKPPS